MVKRRRPHVRTYVADADVPRAPGREPPEGGDPGIVTGRPGAFAQRRLSPLLQVWRLLCDVLVLAVGGALLVAAWGVKWMKRGW